MKFRAFATVIAIAAVVFASGCGSSTPVTGVAHAGQRKQTQARVYYAFTAARPAIRITRTVRGYCFYGSLAIVRRDAWRCFAGKNRIADPCFSSGRAKGIVLCPVPSVPWKRSGVKIKLTKALPKKYGHMRKPSKSGTPWGIQTTSGLKCGVATGMTNFVANRRANFACSSGRQWLWGAPERKYQPWRIYVAPFNARKLTRKAEIRIAWF